MFTKLPRQLLPLLLLYVDDKKPIYGRTRMVKLVFLTQQEVKGLSKFMELYDWIPYHFGPFSDDLIEDLELLRLWGLINIEEEGLEEPDASSESVKYSISSRGERFLESKAISKIPKGVLKKIEELKRRYLTMPIIELLRLVYVKYGYVERSKIKERIL